jgi:hypothetical protein
MPLIFVAISYVWAFVEWCTMPVFGDIKASKEKAKFLKEQLPGMSEIPYFGLIFSV